MDDPSPLLPMVKIQDGSRHAITNLLEGGVSPSLPVSLLLKGHKSGNPPRFPLCFVKKILILPPFKPTRQTAGHASLDIFKALFGQELAAAGREGGSRKRNRTFTDPLSLPLEEQKRVSDSRRRFSLRVKPSPITHVAEIAD
ncbi:hypothetical protein [Rhizobium bangladeshense]|uniref:hypothetical protein n=1 Tax=Rhizobium bangladeshense TaxID=1138189 RepID=UPI0012E86EDE|nr:hypothetical protein [Rhizobium bangladeshense]QSY89833.1 hypothetical protein J2J98_06745 [Rhizobium bangladeshense]